jgi:pimeloyl-ACP methyl ester carboxylesterase
MGVLVLLMAQRAWAAPCTAAGPACTEWITMAGGPARVLLYRTYALDTRNEGVTRALVMVHGAGRDADNYFRHVLAAAFLAGALEDTVIVSPRFASNDGGECLDKLEPGELSWGCRGGETWRSGGAAVADRTLTSYDVADEILRRLARKEAFPNLRAIVVAGHSAGGQFVSRYAMANQIHEGLGVPVTYVVSNPSSYAYPDALRPSRTAVPPDAAAAAPGYVPPPPQSPPPPFAPFSDAQNCTAYDNWPYGLQKRTGYTAGVTEETIKKRLVGRPVTYLLGGLDILPLFGFDGSCSAMAQGPTRLARGLAFGRYVNETFGAQHKTVVVPSCGHNARCMFTADAALPLIFPQP